jgi:hypothetical protein
MKFDEQDVERVAEAIFNETVTYPAWDDLCDTWDSSYGPGKDHYRSIARAAMEAMEREPTRNPHTGLTVEEAWLEIADDMRDVLIERQHELDDQANTSRQLPYATLSGVWVSWDSYYVPDYGCYEAETVEAELNEASEAIRNAVAAAKGGMR